MTGQVIHRDAVVAVTELAFQRYAIVTPHTDPANTTLFVVISGGGFVQVGEERARINHGEAVIWPPGVVHGAYTDGTEMRVITVEFEAAGGPIETRAPEPNTAVPGADDGRSTATRAEGSLVERQHTRHTYDSAEGEPW